MQILFLIEYLKEEILAIIILETADDGCLKIYRYGVKRAAIIVMAAATRKE